MKVTRDRLTSLIVFLVGGIVLILLSSTFDDARSQLALTFGLLAALTFIGTILDPHCEKETRVALHILSGAAIVFCMAGMMIRGEWFTVDKYCMLFGIYGIVKGLVKTYEAINIFKEKNKMEFLFLSDSLFEIAIGILMLVELSASLRLHVFLIGADAIYEGVIKFINEYIEEKKGIVDE